MGVTEYSRVCNHESCCVIADFLLFCVSSIGYLNVMVKLCSEMLSDLCFFKFLPYLSSVCVPVHNTEIKSQLINNLIIKST